LKTVVVSELGKGALDALGRGREDVRHCLRSVETDTGDIKTGVCRKSRDEPGGCPFIGQAVSGIEAT